MQHKKKALKDRNALFDVIAGEIVSGSAKTSTQCMPLRQAGKILTILFNQENPVSNIVIMRKDKKMTNNESILTEHFITSGGKL